MLCFFNDHLALGTLMVCETAGVDVPGDISIKLHGLVRKAVAPMLVFDIRGIPADTKIVVLLPIKTGGAVLAD